LTVDEFAAGVYEVDGILECLHDRVAVNLDHRLVVALLAAFKRVPQVLKELAVDGMRLARSVVGFPRSRGDSFFLDGPVDGEAACLQVSLFGKEEQDDRAVVQTQVRVQAAGPLVLGEAVRDVVEDDGDVAVGGELVACGRAVEVYAAKTLAVKLLEAPPGPGGDLHRLFPRRNHRYVPTQALFGPPIS